MTVRYSKLFAVILVGLLLVLAGLGTLPQHAIAQQATQAAVAQAQFDLRVAVKQYVASLPDGFYGIKPVDALKALQTDPKPLLVDLREAEEIGDGGYIEGAVNVPIRSLIQNLDKLGPKDTPIIVYCASGHRSGLAVMALYMLGYTNVKSIFSGLSAWKADKLPVASGSPQVPTKGLGKPEVDADLFAALDKFLSGLPDGFFGAPVADVFKSLQTTPKPFLLGVREPAELTASGYIEGSLNVPVRTLFDNLDKLPTDLNAPIVVYCAIGHRGAMGMMALRLLGYTNVKSLGGGFNNWAASGMPIVKPAAATAKP